MNTIRAISTLVIFVVGMLLSCPSAAPAQILKINMGSVPSISGFYSLATAMGSTINKYAPEINVTVMESGGGYDNPRRLRDGVFDLGAICTFSTGAYELYKGQGPFVGKPWKDVRLLLLETLSLGQIYIAKDAAGVKNFSDLAGKRFSPGIPGSTTEVVFNRIVEATGVKVNLWPAALADATKSILDGRIIGVYKAGPVDSFDAALKEVNISRPMKMIGLSEQQANAVSGKYPNLIFSYYKKGTCKDDPGSGDFWVFNQAIGTITSTRLSEDVVYRIIKTLYEHWREIAIVYPAAGKVDPLKDIAANVPKDSVPLHSGVVKYAKEKGIDIPKYLIPPEYK